MTNKNVAKIEKFSKEWYEEARQLALDFAPMMYPCKKCNHPVMTGYCCQWCGTSNPDSEED